jgi:hypothetical protein
MADNVESVDTSAPDSAEATTESEVESELDSWAKEEPKAKPRAKSGQFRSTKAPAREKKTIASAVAETIEQGERPREDEEEEQIEEPEEEQPRPRRKVKGIVNGVEEEIDLDDEEFAKVNAVQASRAAQKAWREAAQMRKEAQEFRQALDDARKQVKQDPMALFRALGLSDDEVYGFAQNKTIEKLSETLDPNTGQPYTPEQQKIIQLQRELQQKNLTEQQAKQKQEAIEFEQMKEVVKADIDRKFTTALQETGLPPTQYTMMRLADLMQSMGPDVDPQQVAPLVLEDIVNEVRSTIYSMPMEVAAEILGEDWMNDLRKWDIQKAHAGREKFGRNPRTFPNTAEQRPAPKNGRFMGTVTEAEEYLEKWAEGK